MTTQLVEHPILLRHNGRVVRQPDHYMGIEDALAIIFDDNKDDPLTLSDATKDVDSKV